MPESKLIRPHGSDNLKILLLSGAEREEELKKAETLKKITLSSRETGDLIMMGIGGFTPLDGYMGHDDWKGICEGMKMTDGLFWPIPITLSHDEKIDPGTELCLISGETDEIMGTMKVSESYKIDMDFECKNVFTTNDSDHPGVKMVQAQKEWNVAGNVKVLSESYFPEEFKGIYQRPAESRKIFAEKGWRVIAALQLRNPMHRSHEYLAKIAIEVSDGLYIHQLVGKLKPGDIPADVRVKCINTLVENYFHEDRVVMGGYPLDMRYAGPREGLLHGVFRQNFGCSHMIIGRDHAGVGDYYGPFDAQDAYHNLWDGALECKMLPIDWTFWDYGQGGMASMKTSPEKNKEQRLFLSGTKLRKFLSEGKLDEIPAEFSRPEVLEILKEYYASLKEDEKVEVKLHGHATGEADKK
ncbi:sulfate adenylyltransferase [Bacteroidota bacterium]